MGLIAQAMKSGSVNYGTGAEYIFTGGHNNKITATSLNHPFADSPFLSCIICNNLNNFIRQAEPELDSPASKLH